MAATSIASAQSADVTASAASTDDDPAPSQVIGYGALPGGLHAPSAQTLPKGSVEVATLGGFGWREGLLGEDHRFGRGIGNLAIAFAPHEAITIGLSLDGRYDKHFGNAAMCTDDCNGYVGDPRLLVRAAKASGNLRFGGQLGVWIPGKDAPSVAGSAISFDARGLVSLKAGPGLLSFNAGFRLDNSSKSVEMPASLSIHDRVSLGVSEFHAVVAGVHLGLPIGTKAYVGLESSVDFFIGEGETPLGSSTPHEAPGPLIRFGASAGFHITPQYTFMAFVEGSKVPGILRAEAIAGDIRLIAYEPAITGGIGFQARFGGPAAPSGVIVKNVVPVSFDLFASADGEVVDEAGKPVVGAKVVVKLKNNTGTAVTDDKGAWRVDKLPIGKKLNDVDTIDDAAGEVTVEVDGKKPAKTAITLKVGDNKVERLALDPILPPGQLRAVVRSVVTGKPLAGATVTIEPGAIKATSAADGTFTVDLAPGQYKITVSSPGLAEQQLDVTIDPNGVAIKNIELHR
jgi:hypothetical protein